MLKSLHGLSMLWNILKFVHNLQLKMYEKSPSKRLKITILKNVPRAPALLRQAFMFAFNLKSTFWGTMLWRAKVYNSTKVLSLLFLVSPYVKFSETTYVGALIFNWGFLPKISARCKQWRQKCKPTFLHTS